jgi:hypothetical protein
MQQVLKFITCHLKFITCHLNIAQHVFAASGWLIQLKIKTKFSDLDFICFSKINVYSFFDMLRLVSSGFVPRFMSAINYHESQLHIIS